MPVTRALEEDPPLPGASIEGWPGLRPAAEPATGGHEQHHGQNPGELPADPSGHGAPPAARPTGTSDTGAPPPAATYSCPMHPDVVSDRAGRCPKCGMALERQP
jgi:Heavy metal binding domain